MVSIQLLVEHWLGCFVAVGYVAWCFFSVRRVREYISVLPPRPSRRWGRIRTWKPSWLQPVYRFAVGVIIFLIAPLLARRIGAEYEKKRRELYNDWARVAHVENLRRVKLVDEWVAGSSIVLYCNTIDHITAVVRPADYERTLVETTEAISKGLWTLKKALMPVSPTFLFFEEEGWQLFVRNRSLIGIEDGSQAWDRTIDLKWWVEKCNITLVTKSDLFVPFVNESILPFEEHSHQELRQFNMDLVRAQAPAEIQPVSLYDWSE